MHDVIVDTNVLIRAFIRRESSDGKLLQMIIEDRLQFWFSLGLLRELHRVLSYPRLVRYGAREETIGAFIQTLAAHGISIVPDNTTVFRDADDNEIIGVAMAVAENEPVALISADKDILVLTGSVERVSIMTPQKFLKTQM